MTEVVSVRFKNKGKVYFFDPAGIVVSSGDSVIVETAKGLEFAECTIGNHLVDDSTVILPLRPIIRVATEEDHKRADENKKKESDAFAICQEKIVKHDMDMKLVDVEFNFEGNKILFFFTSDGRVDFRDLVKDLASVFKMRIELRQIGVRDEARMLGGLGICGKQFCCTQFLDEFQPVSIKMAKTQGLSLNPAKISGTCGRLMCCLKYEQNAYEDLIKKAPKVDAFVETEMGKGTVVGINLLRGTAKVRLENPMDTAWKTFAFSEIEVLGGKAKRAEYIAARAEGLENRGVIPKPFTPNKHKTEQVPKPEPKHKPEVGVKVVAKPEIPAQGSPLGKSLPQENNKPANKTDGHRRHRRGRGKGKKPGDHKVENKTGSEQKSE